MTGLKVKAWQGRKFMLDTANATNAKGAQRVHQFHRKGVTHDSHPGNEWLTKDFSLRDHVGGSCRF